MIEISVVNESVWSIEAGEDTVAITFEQEGDCGAGAGNELKLGKSLITRLCELMPNELIAGYVESKKEAEQQETVAKAKMREAMRRVLKAEGELYSVKKELESVREEALQLEI